MGDLPGPSSNVASTSEPAAEARRAQQAKGSQPEEKKESVGRSSEEIAELQKKIHASLEAEDAATVRVKNRSVLPGAPCAESRSGPCQRRAATPGTSSSRATFQLDTRRRVRACCLLDGRLSAPGVRGHTAQRLRLATHRDCTRPRGRARTHCVR